MGGKRVVIWQPAPWQIAFGALPCSAQRHNGIDDDNDDTTLVRLPGCKIMLATGGVHWPSTDSQPPTVREVCSNRGRVGGKNGRALLLVAVTIVDLLNCWVVQWCWVVGSV